MDATETDSAVTLEIDFIERWNVFNRLQELSIPCQCSCGQPLQVKIETAATAVQVWSVIRRFVLPRGASVEYLERCWRQAVRQ